jgi:hypothetical protein
MENLDFVEADHSDKGSTENFRKDTIADFTTQNGSVSDNGDSTRKSEERYINKIHQVCAQGGNPGYNHKKEKDKVYVSAGEWKTIMSAVNHGT